MCSRSTPFPGSLFRVLESSNRIMAADGARGKARAGRSANAQLLEPGIEVCNYSFAVQ